MTIILKALFTKHDINFATEIVYDSCGKVSFSQYNLIIVALLVGVRANITFWENPESMVVCKVRYTNNCPTCEMSDAASNACNKHQINILFAIFAYFYIIVCWLNE